MFLLVLVVGFVGLVGSMGDRRQFTPLNEKREHSFVCITMHSVLGFLSLLAMVKSMVNHGKAWLTMVSYGKQWLTMVNHG